MENENRTELFSIRANAGSRTYFFDVKQSQDGTRHLVVSESRQNEAGRYDHHRVMVFEEHLEEFQRAMTEAIDNLQKLREPTKAYSVDEIRKDHPMAYAKWTPEDDRRLWALHRSGCSVKELSAEFNRKSGAIESRLRHLGMQAVDAGRQPTAVGGKYTNGDLHPTAPLESSSGSRGHTAQQDAQPDREQAGESSLPF
jgi:hypothetical protein